MEELDQKENLDDYQVENPEANLDECQEEGLKEEPVMIRDRVGEMTDLNACPVCASHTDCFANIEGHCTALRKTDEVTECPFYKNAEENIAEAKRCYQRLKDKGRSDLISMYIKPLSAMGMLDDEIEAAAEYGEEFENFRESNYQEQLEKMLEDNGFDDDLLDDSDDVDDEIDEIDDETDIGEESDEAPDEGEEDMDAWEPGWDDARYDGGA